MVPPWLIRMVAEPFIPMSRHDPQMRIRIPVDAKAFVEAQAIEDASSQNSVIVRAIRAAMKAKGPAATAIAPDRGPNNPHEEKADGQQVQ